MTVAYHPSYVDEVIETQGKLFLHVAEAFPACDTSDWITRYMKSRTRQYIDEGHPSALTRDVPELLEMTERQENIYPVPGEAMAGFMPDWIGEFYALFQWKYNVPSRTLVELIPVSLLEQRFGGLHDLDLEVAVDLVYQNARDNHVL